MDIDHKLGIAKRAIESITRHDDAPPLHVQEAANELKAHIDREVADAMKRRAAKADAKA